MAQQRDKPDRDFGRMLRRAALAAVIVLSALGVLASLVGIGMVWRAKGRLATSGAANLARVASALGVSGASLQVINTNLDAIDEEQLAAAGRTLVAIPDVVVGIDATLRAVNEIPFVSVPTIDQELLRAIGERVDTLSAALATARQRRAGEGSAADLEAVRAASADLAAQVRAAEARVSTAQASWPRWLDRAAFVLTALLLWLAIAQAGLGRLAWERWRRAAAGGPR